MMNKEMKYMSLFLLITFILPLLAVLMQSIMNNTIINFTLFGMEAAAPSIAAVIVLIMSSSFKEFREKYFHSRHLILAIVLPICMVCASMCIAKVFFCLGTNASFIFGRISGRQLIIILWALIAEELGWRGYLQPFLYKNVKWRWLVPAIVGGVWCIWHYHYFLFGDMNVPIVWFAIGCIAESYIYSYLLERTDNNLISAMLYHFAWNLFVHLFAINPIDNDGNKLPYALLAIIEVVIAFAVSVIVKKKEKTN